MTRLYVSKKKKPGRHIGTWTLPSGNIVDVYVWLPRNGGEGKGFLQWKDDRSVEDEWHYGEVIEPEVAQRIHRLFEMSPKGKLFFGPVEVEQ